MRPGPRPHRRLVSAGLLAAVLGPCLGCAGYQVGADTLYRPDIRTVYVPIFESNSFRRDLGERLTEAVVKEIELKTPYKVVSDLSADSILTGRIVTDQKRVLAENVNDWPIDTELAYGVQVAWRDRRGTPIGPPVNIPLFPSALSISQSTHFVPESGQSITVAQLTAIDQLAEQIVAQMETPW